MMSPTNSAPGRPARKPLRLDALVIVLLVVAGLYFFVYRNFYYDPPDRERSRARNQWFERGFTIATVWPPHTDNSLIEGVKLALWELDNKRPDICGSNLEPPGTDYTLLAGKIRLWENEETSDSGAIAHEIASRKDVLAVIGHELAGTAIPASLTYERNGIIFLAPKTTDQRLTHHQFRYMFRLVPDDEGVATTLAAFAKSKNWNRVGVIFGRTDRGRLASDQFVTAAREAGLTLPFSHSFFHDPEPVAMLQDFRSAIGEFRKLDFDAIMIADDFPWAAKLLLDLRQMGVTKPILTTDKLDTKQLLQEVEYWETTGVRNEAGAIDPEDSAVSNLYVASAVDPASTSFPYRYFRDRFRSYWEGVDTAEHPASQGAEPGYGSSQGYEAACLFIKAVMKTKTADPVVVATTLKANTWPGLFGDYTFNANGDVVGRTISIKTVKNYEFVSLPREIEPTDALKDDGGV